MCSVKMDIYTNCQATKWRRYRYAPVVDHLDVLSPFIRSHRFSSYSQWAELEQQIRLIRIRVLISHNLHAADMICLEASKQRDGIAS